MSLICVRFFFIVSSLSQQWGRFPSRGDWLLYEWRTILCYPLLQPPSLPTSSRVFHQHPLFSPAAVVTGGWRSGGSRVGRGLKAGKRLAVYLWKCMYCSGVEEALNVAVAAMLGMWASALPGLDRRSPQLYLRKWQSGAHRPLTAPLCFSVSLSLGSTPPPPPFLLCTIMVIIFLYGLFPGILKVYFHTC